MNIKTIFPFVAILTGISLLFFSNYSIKKPLKVPIDKVSGSDLYVEYVINPLEIYEKNIPLILEKLTKENFDFDNFKESIKIDNPVKIKEVLLKQELLLKTVLNSYQLNVIIFKNYRVNSNSLNERVLDIISRL